MTGRGIATRRGSAGPHYLFPGKPLLMFPAPTKQRLARQLPRLHSAGFYFDARMIPPDEICLPWDLKRVLRTKDCFFWSSVRFGSDFLGLGDFLHLGNILDLGNNLTVSRLTISLSHPALLCRSLHSHGQPGVCACLKVVII